MNSIPTIYPLVELFKEEPFGINYFLYPIYQGVVFIKKILDNIHYMKLLSVYCLHHTSYNYWMMELWSFVDLI
jgi:hypothetical protein